MFKLSRLLPLLAGLLLTAALNASPVVWTVHATFDDGGTASGSFVFDASLGVFTFVDITTTTGSVRTGAHYTRANLVAASSTFVLELTSATGDLTGTPSFAGQLVSPMTNAGGSINFSLSGFHQEESCANAGCTGGAPPRRFMLNGSVTAAPAPTPAPPTLILMLSGLAFAAAFAARKRIGRLAG
jgi:hypothetical protein